MKIQDILKYFAAAGFAFLTLPVVSSMLKKSGRQNPQFLKMLGSWFALGMYTLKEFQLFGRWKN